MFKVRAVLNVFRREKKREIQKREEHSGKGLLGGCLKDPSQLGLQLIPQQLRQKNQGHWFEHVTSEILTVVLYIWIHNLAISSPT